MKSIWLISTIIAGLISCPIYAQKNVCPAQGAPAGPHIVNETEFTNQATPIASTTIFTPEVAGVFRISTYIEFTALAPVPWNVCPSVSWTDDSLTQHSVDLVTVLGGNLVSPYACIFNDPNENFSGSGTTVIRAQAGTPVVLDVSTLAVAPGEPPYSIYLTIERLSQACSK